MVKSGNKIISPVLLKSNISVLKPAAKKVVLKHNKTKQGTFSRCGQELHQISEIKFKEKIYYVEIDLSLRVKNTCPHYYFLLNF